MTGTAESSFSRSLVRLYPLSREVVPRLALGLTTAVLASAVALAIPQVLQWIVNGPLFADSDPVALWWGVGIVLALGIAEAALLTARRQLVLAPGTKLEAKLRVRLYAHLTELPVAFHDEWGSGQLLSRSMSDIRRFRRWISFGMIMICVNAITIAIGTALMFASSWLLGVIYAAAALPVLVMSFRFRRRYRIASRLAQDQAGDLATVVEESVRGIRVLKAFGRGRDALDSFAARADELRETELSKSRSLSTVSMLLTLLPEAALAVALVVGAFLVADGDLTVGALVAFFATAALVNGPLGRLGEQFAMSMDAKAAIDRYFEVLDVPNTILDPAEGERQSLDAPIGMEPSDSTDASINTDASNSTDVSDVSTARSGRVERGIRLEFADVRFRYPDAPPEAPDLLDGVDLVVEPGETLALVALTGGGKSTLAQLVPRLYDVTGGAVRVGGIDVRHLDRLTLRTHVSMAFEDPVLFSASVRENVLLGVPDAGDDVLRQALDVAGADFVHSLPGGVDAMIGEEGLSLSGGQRQRIALARAIAPAPRVLILDDPLSALDVRTEALVTERLRASLRGTTTLVVAHRPSTVALADRVALLHEGRIVAVDTHAELLATHELYRSVLARQARPVRESGVGPIPADGAARAQRTATAKPADASAKPAGASAKPTGATAIARARR
ncbi:ABC transporter ATP-binding protein [Agromyces larvae]|uniref:ABC transporter ATP-binding protein/permease n=1 Tax=Agromyces larvae TaxID=2929802 RepID=A0ABY4BVY7_9MICO|nr:ABC transporter ATP-binding protein [Agromyces larvae]UOE43357.1 ABC transporter ATP-binding protein/permease [Agromyces larvae]